MSPSPSRELVSAFMLEAQRAVLEDDHTLYIDRADILLIADSAAARSRFWEEFFAINNDNTRRLIRDYLSDVIHDLESAAEKAEGRLELVDRGALAPAATVSTAGVVALASGAAAAPLLLIFGLAGLGVSAGGRAVLRATAQRHRASVRKLKQLRENLS